MVRLRLLTAFIVLIAAIWFFSIPTIAPSADKAERARIPEIERGEVASPVVTENEVTFYAQGESGATPRVVSDLTGWGERPDGTFDFEVGRMHQVAGTNWFTLSARMPPSSRIEYLFSYGAGDYRLDPKNPRRVTRVGGDASEVVGPAYVPPPEFSEPPVTSAGAITEAMAPGAIVGERRVIVYTPPGYDAAKKYRLAVFHDGALVVNTGQAPRVIDWLIANNRIEPIVAVFVEPVSRVEDFRIAAPMRDFVATELMSWIGSRYSITPVAADHAIIGISAGGRGALDAMATYPNVFGKSGLMIPAIADADVSRIPVRRAEREQLRVCVLAASYDRLNLAGAKLARDSLSDRGHSVKYIEVPEGHSTLTWKTHLRDVLISLFGR